MNKCVFYIDSRHGITLCMAQAQYMVNGSSFCGEHVKEALKGVTWKAKD